MNDSIRTLGRNGLTFSLLAAILLLPSIAVGDFEIKWRTIDGGGATRITGGIYELSGTIGQHDADTAAMTGGVYELSGGFWAGVPACTCLSDINHDGQRDGRDVEYFLDCILGAGSNCACADVDPNSVVDLNDLGLFIDDLLAGETCP